MSASPGASPSPATPSRRDAVEFLTALCDRAHWVATLSTPERAYRRAEALPPWAANAPEWLKPVTTFDGVPRDAVLSLLAELREGDAHLAELEAWAGRLAMHNAVSFNGEALLTVTAAGVDKGAGLLALCAATGIDPRNAIAIGDSEVDLPMFAVAGTSIAMGNATAAVQARATRITATADADGVAQALRALAVSGRCDARAPPHPNHPNGDCKGAGLPPTNHDLASATHASLRTGPAARSARGYCARVPVLWYPAWDRMQAAPVGRGYPGVRTPAAGQPRPREAAPGLPPACDGVVRSRQAGSFTVAVRMVWVGRPPSPNRHPSDAYTASTSAILRGSRHERPARLHTNPNPTCASGSAKPRMAPLP